MLDWNSWPGAANANRNAGRERFPRPPPSPPNLRADIGGTINRHAVTQSNSARSPGLRKTQPPWNRMQTRPARNPQMDKTWSTHAHHAAPAELRPGQGCVMALTSIRLQPSRGSEAGLADLDPVSHAFKRAAATKELRQPGYKGDDRCTRHTTSARPIPAKDRSEVCGGGAPRVPYGGPVC